MVINTITDFSKAVTSYMINVLVQAHANYISDCFN